MMGKIRAEFESMFNPPEWSGFDGASNDYFLLWSELDWREVDEELTRYNRDWQVWQASRGTISVKIRGGFDGIDEEYLTHQLNEAGVSYA